MGTKTKYFSSLMVGASANSNVAGSLIGILDSVLVNGFGAASPSSVVVAAGVATVSWPAAHPYVTDSVMLMSGATNNALNGEKRVTATGANTVTFLAPGVPDGAAAGVITTKVAPLGWTKLYTGANLAVYKPSAPEASGCVLRVDDTGTTVARVRGYEAMTDVNTGTGPFPTLTQVAAPGLFWPKASAAGRPWRIIGDDRGFYWMPSPSSSHETYVMWFGDPLSLRTNDPYGCVLQAQTADRTVSSGTAVSDEISNSDNGRNAGTTSGAYVARNANALGTAQSVSRAVSGPMFNNPGLCGSSSFPPFPSPVDNGLQIGSVAVVHDNTQGTRGWFPGVYGALLNAAASFNTDDTIDGAGPLAGKKLRAVKTQLTSGGSTTGLLAFNVLDDWR